MDKEEFLKIFPERKTESHKGENGEILLCGGSYGLAGALCLNILGAKCLGASYIHVYLEDYIYQIASLKHTDCVYHPFSFNNPSLFLDKDGVLKKVKACAFGCGVNNLNERYEILSLLFKNASCPLVIDAEGIRMLANNNYLDNHTQDVILTPHLGELSALTKRSIDDIKENKEEIGINYAKEKNVYLVIKGPNSLVISPKGEVYINNSGNQALARAGSGDILTGMITTLCALNNNTYEAVKGAVWFHGHLADLAVEKHSHICLNFDDFLDIADGFFKDCR